MQCVMNSDAEGYDQVTPGRKFLYLIFLIHETEYMKLLFHFSIDILIYLFLKTALQFPIIYMFQACRWNLAWLLLVHPYGCKGLWWLAKDQSRKWNWRLKKLLWYGRLPALVLLKLIIVICRSLSIHFASRIDSSGLHLQTVEVALWNQKINFLFGLELRREKTVVKLINFNPSYCIMHC